MNRQRLLLAVFLGLFICSLLYSFLRMPRQKTVDKLKYVQGMNAPAPRTPLGKDSDNTRVKLELLEAKERRSFSGGKNIFYNLFAEGPKKTVSPLPLPPPPPEKPPLPLPVPKPPEVAGPTPLQKEMAAFTFLGFLKKENRKIIFLTNGKEIFLVKKGDKIAGKYDVTSLTDEALTISSINDKEEIVIPLVENRPLNASRK